MAYNRPCISIDVFHVEHPGKPLWITERSISGHNIGVHISVEGAAEVVSLWAGMGWCLFGRKFVEELTKEFRELFPELPELTKGYDCLDSKPNYVRVFNSAKDKLAAEIEIAQAGTEV